MADNNVKCGEIIIFYRKFYQKFTKFSSHFVPAVEILSRKCVPGGGWNFLTKNLVALGVARGEGMVTG